MRVAVLLALVLTTAPGLVQAQRSARDSAERASRDSVRAQLRQVTRDARRVGRAEYERNREPLRVSPEDSVSAFRDPEARRILYRARVARMAQDSALQSYRAITTQRMSLGLGVRRLGLEKRLFRGDNVARVEWSRGGGVWVTPIGSRIDVPMAGDVDESDGDFVDAVTIPYFPGKETLWIPSGDAGVVQSDIDERDLIHPVARGAEAYYRYAAGDSITIRLDNERSIRLRELRITARKPQWRLFVGSFWFDQESGQLVRAAYRLAVPIEIWDVASEEIDADKERDALVARARDSIARERLSREEYVADSVRQSRQSDDDEPPGWVKASFRPAKAMLDAVTIEFGLYGGRFWLPRANSATFSAQMGPLRAPFTMDETFEYEVVNGDFSMPPVPERRTAADDSLAALAGDTAQRPRVAQDSGDGTTIVINVGSGSDSVALARADSVFRASRCAPGDSSYLRTESRYNGALRVAYTMPCDRTALRTSEALPELDGSGDDLFDTATRDQLLDALGLDLQPEWGPQMPTVRSGLDQIRYNRVEGLSVGVLAEQVLGAGYTARATARLGHADTELNGSLGFERSNGRRTIYGTVYRRLRATAPEWGDPLSFGPSLPAILFARDEGFYFRAIGAEVGDRRINRNGAFEWRLYTEQQQTAGDSSVVNTWSLGRSLGVGRFRGNFDASKISLTGLEVAWSRAMGSDPEGTRLVTSLRGEGATGTVTFGRASIENTLSRPVGSVALALTGSAGTSVGDLPPQRGWFLGGLRTVRGNPPGSVFGDAYWFLRAEAGTKFGAVRPVLFFDAGWSGARDTFGEGRMLRGAGAGFSILDGILRLDIARGLGRGLGWRTDLYLQAPL